MQLRVNIPDLFKVAKEARRRDIIGIASYKPPNSHPEKEKLVFDFVGMLGLPFVPCHEFPAKAPAAFFSVHALKDAEFIAKLAKFIAAGKPVLLTDSLALQLEGKVDLHKPNVQVLPVKGDPKSLLELSSKELDEIRERPLHPVKNVAAVFREASRQPVHLAVNSKHEQRATSEQDARNGACRKWAFDGGIAHDARITYPNPATPPGKTSAFCFRLVR